MLTLHEQKLIVLPYLGRSLRRVAALTLRDSDHIARLAAHRLEAGFTLYGDAVFLSHPDRLLRDVHEELADAAVYAAVAEHHGVTFGADASDADPGIRS